jgi:hypothetical protein
MERPIVRVKSCQTPPEWPALSLTWSLDPATGKPMARWTSERPEMIASFALRPAA